MLNQRSSNHSDFKKNIQLLSLVWKQEQDKQSDKMFLTNRKVGTARRVTVKNLGKGKVA